MQALDGVGARHAQHLVATLESATAEVVGAQILQLQVGARRAVEDEDASGESRQVGVRGLGTGEGGAGIVHWHFRICARTACYYAEGVKIYTRRGDKGTTGLLFGGRVAKTSAPIEVNGAVDEAQAALGWARSLSDASSRVNELLVSLERDLWVLMAEVATLEENRHKLVDNETRVSAAMVERLEAVIDDLSKDIIMPEEFIVPGESQLSAALDVARTVIRRAERRAVGELIDGSFVVAYLNRLSDLVWTIARWVEGPQHRTARDA